MGATKRIKNYIEYKGISKYKFCQDLGFSNKFLDNSDNMGTDKACKILHYYPEINPEWLLTGKGEMLKNIEIYNSDIETITERLVHFKIQNNLTYHDLGSILEITPAEMRKLINKSQINEEHISVITEKFDISKEWFLKGKENVPKINKEKIQMISEPTTNYIKEDNDKILEKEMEFLKETIISLKETVVSLREANNSLKEINELLKDKIKGLEAKN